MESIVLAAQDPGFGASVAGVVADRQAAGLEIAAKHGIPTAVVSPSDFPDRATWDEALARTVAAFNPDIVVLAGFMRIVGAPLLTRFEGRVVNTHPALLPAFPGAKAVADALAAGVKITGCTFMVVDEGIDTGPILAQRAVEVREDDNEARLHARIKEAERDLVVATLGLMAREGWTVSGRTTRLGTQRQGATQQ